MSVSPWHHIIRCQISQSEAVDITVSVINPSVNHELRHAIYVGHIGPLQALQYLPDSWRFGFYTHHTGASYPLDHKTAFGVTQHSPVPFLFLNIILWWLLLPYGFIFQVSTFISVIANLPSGAVLLFLLAGYTDTNSFDGFA